MFDERKNMRRLVEVWIAQAEARQRAGRAGRVRAGHCFKLYTRFRATRQMEPARKPRPPPPPSAPHLFSRGAASFSPSGSTPIPIIPAPLSVAPPPPARKPEMLRGPLQELCLQLRLAPLLSELDIRAAFARCLEAALLLLLRLPRSPTPSFRPLGLTLPHPLALL